MNENSIALVTESWATVSKIEPAIVAGMFYDRLFSTHPEVRVLFKGDMQLQGHKLMSMLQLLVNGLNDLPLEDVRPIVAQLGRDHVHYGAKMAHYEAVGDALIWTLAQGLGSEFTPEVKAAWLELYVLLANVMKEAAAEEENSAAAG